MVCPKCKTKDALMMFNSYLCVNRSCAYYDSSWSDEVSNKKQEEEDPYITSTFTDNDTTLIEWIIDEDIA